MKIKDKFGDWQVVSTELSITISGKNHKEIIEIGKMLEDFVSTTLSTQYSMSLTETGTTTKSIPYVNTQRILKFTRIN